MNIAVTADGQSLTSKVSEQFDSCNYLLIVHMEDLSVHTIKNENTLTEETLANEVIHYDCEAIITGKLNQPAFDILTDACITRYWGTGHSVETALNFMEKQLLKLIRNYQGTDECSGHHHHGEKEKHSHV